MEFLVQLFWRLVSLVASPKCQHEFFVKFNLLHVECLRATLSKGLGLGIVAGASLVKLPQVFKLVSSGSAEGLSLPGVMMELIAVSGSTAYCYVNDFPFSTYGEGVFLILQTAILAAVILYLTDRAIAAFLFSLTLPVLLLLLVSPLTPPLLLWGIQSGCVPIVVTAKLIQALANYRRGGTGQLSLITILLLFLGSLARVFTSFQETGDPALIATHVSGSAANGLLVAQLLYYNSRTAARRSSTATRSSSKKE